MNSFEREIAKYFGEDNLKILQAVTIGIAGCGGLGSNCANSLVRSGIKNLVLVDFDKVEESNLNRQFFFKEQIGINKVEALAQNLLKINSGLNVSALCRRLEKDNILNIFKTCDIVVEAFDRAEYKSLLIEILLPTGKFLVSASGLAGFGNSDEITIRYPKKNLALIGDLKSQASNRLPPLSPRVNIAAAKQADVILQYLLGQK
ncbi:MAG: sulfur carrier protein ThiS adenylyltransferase ThiF [Candidatus Omnitrophica bacterium]|nr:sulfur carrier protein ThiS adenylyltransferase ThiF [Candidatus Omnitrophota bacterium]